MRLVDLVLRQGHLSDKAITGAVVTGDRPGHLDQCEVCARRALEQNRWLDDLRELGVDAADTAFPAERLAAQQGQILRRLEQLDEPSRVLAFPRQSAYELRDRRHRVAPAWVGVAAAAGLVVGVISGHMTASVNPATTEATAATQPAPRAQEPRVVPNGLPTAQPAAARNASLLDIDWEFTPTPLQSLDDSTPKLTASYTTADNRN